MLATIFRTPKLFLPLVRLAHRLLALPLVPKIIKFGNSVFVFKWKDVADVLKRDDDFRIEPINKSRIDAVSGPFFLGMDRKREFFEQRHAGYHSFFQQDWANLPVFIEKNAEKILKNSGQSFDLVSDYLWPVATATSIKFFGVKAADEEAFKVAIRAVFHETFLNLGNDKKVREKGEEGGKALTSWTNAEIRKRRKSGKLGDDFLGGLLRSMAEKSDEEITHISNGYLVGSIDTTVTTATNILYEFVSNASVLNSVRNDIDNDRRFVGWMMEVLRRRPHNPIILRQAARDTKIGEQSVKKGAQIFAITLSAMQDSAVFTNPKELIPTRQFDRYMHFGYGVHACAGRDLNFVQLPILVKAILKRNPTSIGKISFVGPFPGSVKITLGET